MCLTSTWFDGIVNLIGWIVGEASYIFRRVQSGLIQNYALAMVIGVFVFMTWYVLGR